MAAVQGRHGWLGDRGAGWARERAVRLAHAAQGAPFRPDLGLRRGHGGRAVRRHRRLQHHLPDRLPGARGVLDPRDWRPPPGRHRRHVLPQKGAGGESARRGWRGRLRLLFDAAAHPDQSHHRPLLPGGAGRARHGRASPMVADLPSGGGHLLRVDAVVGDPGADGQPVPRPFRSASHAHLEPDRRPRHRRLRHRNIYTRPQTRPVDTCRWKRKGGSMPRPVVLIHGYSAEGKDFENFKQALVSRGIDSKDIDICNYISLNNEITIKDIAEGLDRALRSHPVLGNETEDFDAIVHSTGMLVLRAWLANAGPPATNPRLQRLKHLVGLAPATWGSPQAHKGRTWLGAMVKGNRQMGPDFLNAGDRVLEGLELGSKFTWDLAHLDLLGPDPFYDKGNQSPYVAVFIGNTPYEGLASLANDPGTDGTVRWSGCSLNARKITIDLTRIPVANASRLSITPWADSRLDIRKITIDLTRIPVAN